MNRRFLCKAEDWGRLSWQVIPAFHREIPVSCAAIVVTLIAIIALSVEGGTRLAEFCGETEWTSAAELIFQPSMLGFFMFSGLVYQLTRLGYLRRFSTHRATPSSELECVYNSQAPSLAILVPSYKEEPHVVRQTLIAMARQVPTGEDTRVRVFRGSSS